MKVILILCSFLLLSINSYAQRMQFLKQGNTFYKEGEYIKAIEQYEKLWSSTAGAKLLGVDAKMNLANAYRVMDQPFKAKDLYQEVMQYGGDRISIYLEYGKVLMSLGRYDEAIEQFKLYAQKDETSTEPAELIERARNIETIEPLYAQVTVSEQAEVNKKDTRQVGITYYGDGVVFASDELDSRAEGFRSKSYLNMRVSGVNIDGDLKTSEKFSPTLNSDERHDGPATFSRDGLHIFYSQSATTRDGKNVLQIWSSSYRSGAWTEPRPLEFMSQGSNYTHPSLSADGRTLYFASDMKGSFGGLDVWMSNYESGSWTYPINLGKDINTSKDDAWPFIHPDGDLYYSSKGHPGYGSYDIFRTRPLGNGVDWLPIENLGQPFNSSFNDVSFILSDDQTQGFFASNSSKSYAITKYEIVSAERQELPEGVKPRTSPTIIAGRRHPVLVNDDIPERPVDMPMDTYIEMLDSLAEKGVITLPTPDNSSVVEGDPLPEENPGESPVASIGAEDPVPTTKNNTGVSSAYTDKESLVLVVVLKVTDVANSRPLSGAKVIVRNKFTQAQEEFSVDERGEVEVSLKPDQKYSLIGVSEGYQESSLPVSTMGVVNSDRVQANLPLAKQ
ncbi:MAG: hypothetical protein ACRBFS_13085 [Aureispira sp.]